jgi:hypothetical protein
VVGSATRVGASLPDLWAVTMPVDLADEHAAVAKLVR